MLVTTTLPGIIGADVGGIGADADGIGADEAGDSLNAGSDISVDWVLLMVVSILAVSSQPLPLTGLSTLIVSTECGFRDLSCSWEHLTASRTAWWTWGDDGGQGASSGAGNADGDDVPSPAAPLLDAVTEWADVLEDF